MRSYRQVILKTVLAFLILLLLPIQLHAAAWTPADAMSTTRMDFTTTLLQDGRVVVIGGRSSHGGGAYHPRCEIYDPAANQWRTSYGLMIEPRAQHTATLLPNNRILVVGGSNDSGVLNSVEVYDVDTDTWTEVASLNYARSQHTATRLRSTNQRVLVVGGYTGSGPSDTFEVYDPVEDEWVAGALDYYRVGHTAVMTPSGQVLVCGGNNGSQNLTSCQLFNPGIRTWTDVDGFDTARAYHTTTFLPDNRILVTGGNGGWSSAELFDWYNQSTGWVPADSSLNYNRSGHTAALLPNGSVLIAGSDGTVVSTSEMFNPASNTFGQVTNMVDLRYDSFAMTLLHSGSVLMVGGTGEGGYILANAEVYHWATPAVTTANSMLASCPNHTATLLPDGRVLVAAGRVPGSGSYY